MGNNVIIIVTIFIAVIVIMHLNRKKPPKSFLGKIIEIVSVNPLDSNPVYSVGYINSEGQRINFITETKPVHEHFKYKMINGNLHINWLTKYST